VKKAIIFDLNGIFIEPLEYLRDRFEREYGVKTEKFLTVLKRVMAKVRMPNANSVYSYCEPSLKEWGIGMNEEEFLEYWFSAEKENTNMVDLARELMRKRVRLIVLSSNFKERTAYYKKHFPFLTELFEKVYYSWQTGFVKPDEQAFRLIFKENNLEPSECVYFDDSEKNVEVGNSLGIDSHFFVDASGVKKTLKNYLVK